MEEIRVGDIVMCVEYPGNPCGIVVKQYRPTACGQQTIIKCNDGDERKRKDGSQKKPTTDEVRSEAAL